MNIKKNDTVIVITGKDKGKKGKVLKVLQKESKIIVEGINIIKKHMKPSQMNQEGGIYEREAAMAISNVMIADPKTSKPTKVGVKVVDGKKVRYAKKSGELLDK